MSRPLLLDSTDAINRLAHRLGECQDVIKLGQSDGDPENSALAYALSELESSFVAMVDKHLPRLVDPSTSESEVCDVLHEIGEELRHILYHIGASKYYSYLPAWGGARD